MPAGRSRMGRNTPTTQGSSRAPVSSKAERTSTLAGISKAGISKGVLARTAARMRSQPRNRISVTPTNPHTHTPSIAMGVQSTGPGAEGTNDRVSANGWVICSIVDETVSVAIFSAARVHCRWLPRLISSENGTKNLNDALNHNQKRTWARFLRSASVSSPAATAKSVDCQRWLVHVSLLSCIRIYYCIVEKPQEKSIAAVGYHAKAGESPCFLTKRPPSSPAPPPESAKPSPGYSPPKG